MTATPRRLRRRPTIALLAIALIAPALLAVRPSDVRPPLPDATEVATIREARLRKLHLVRPDLIHYPISFDVVC